MKRTNEDQFDELHSLVTTEITARIKGGEASTADLRAAIEWLKVNSITGAPAPGSPLEGLMGVIPELDFSDVN